MPKNRRSVLKSTGAAIVGIGTVTNAVSAAGKSDETVGASEIGIANAVDELIEKNKFQKASDLLEKHDVRHGFDQYSVPTDAMYGSDVSTSADKNECSFYSSWYESTYPVYTVTNSFTLVGNGGMEVVAGPADGVGFGWAGDRWAYDYPSFESGTQGHDDDYLDDAVSHGNGLTCDYHGIELYDGQERGGWARIDIEKQESGQHNVWLNYAHTWESYWQNLSVSFGISYGGGAITVNWDGSDGGEWRTVDNDYGVLEI